MTDNTHVLQQIAARAITRATGRRMRFIPGGDETLAFDVAATYSPHPFIRFPDGSMIQSEDPVMFVSANQLSSLEDAEGATREPEGGEVSPDYVCVNPGFEGRRKVRLAELQHNGFWKLTLTNPVSS